MLKKFIRFINYSILSSLLFIILGLFIIIFPQTSLSLFSYCVAVMGIILGIYLVILDITSKDRFLTIDTMFQRILLLVLGIILLIYPDTISKLIPIVLGIWFILSGVNKIRISTLLRGIDNSSFIITLLSAILSVVCGFIFIVNPLTSSSVITIISGLTIIVYAMSNMVDTIIFKKHLNNISKEIKKRITIIDEE